MSSLLRRYANLEAHQRPTVGDTKTSTVVVDHLGWLLCDGRSLNVSDWYFLFSVIGYQFGGSGATFNLPSPAGRVMGIIGAGSGLTARTMGDISGTETHTLIINEMPAHTHGSSAVTGNNNGNGLTSITGSHTHTATDSGHSHAYNSVAASLATVSGGPADNTELGSNTTGTGYANITVAANGDHQHQIFNTGGGAPHLNMQPTLFLGNLFIYSGAPTYGVWPITNLSSKSQPYIQ